MLCGRWPGCWAIGFVALPIRIQVTPQTPSPALDRPYLHQLREAKVRSRWTRCRGQTSSLRLLGMSHICVFCEPVGSKVPPVDSLWLAGHERYGLYHLGFRC